MNGESMVIAGLVAALIFGVTRFIYLDRRDHPAQPVTKPLAESHPCPTCGAEGHDVTGWIDAARGYRRYFCGHDGLRWRIDLWTATVSTE